MIGTKIRARFEVTNWDEQPFDEGPGMGKLTRAHVTKTYSGDIEGDSVTEWLMAYAADGTATFVGLERIKGTVGGRRGSVVLQHVGRFENGAAKATLMVVPASGTDDLASAGGTGEFLADPSGSLWLDLSVA